MEENHSIGTTGRGSGIEKFLHELHRIRKKWSDKKRYEFERTHLRRHWAWKVHTTRDSHIVHEIHFALSLTQWMWYFSLTPNTRRFVSACSHSFISCRLHSDQLESSFGRYAVLEFVAIFLSRVGLRNSFQYYLLLYYYNDLLLHTHTQTPGLARTWYSWQITWA